jgi:hypothetical protein
MLTAIVDKVGISGLKRASLCGAFYENLTLTDYRYLG